jgi:hypothetical protein
LITIIRTCAERNNWVATPKVKITLKGPISWRRITPFVTQTNKIADAAKK